MLKDPRAGPGPSLKNPGTISGKWLVNYQTIKKSQNILSCRNTDKTPAGSSRWSKGTFQGPISDRFLATSCRKKFSGKNRISQRGGVVEILRNFSWTKFSKKIFFIFAKLPKSCAVIFLHVSRWSADSLRWDSQKLCNHLWDEGPGRRCASNRNLSVIILKFYAADIRNVCWILSSSNCIHHSLIWSCFSQIFFTGFRITLNQIIPLSHNQYLSFVFMVKFPFLCFRR